MEPHEDATPVPQPHPGDYADVLLVWNDGEGWHWQVGSNNGRHLFGSVSPYTRRSSVYRAVRRLGLGNAEALIAKAKREAREGA